MVSNNKAALEKLKTTEAKLIGVLGNVNAQEKPKGLIRRLFG
jgi:hypothetical protein